MHHFHQCVHEFAAVTLPLGYLSKKNTAIYPYNILLVVYHCLFPFPLPRPPCMVGVVVSLQFLDLLYAYFEVLVLLHAIPDLSCELGNYVRLVAH